MLRPLVYLGIIILAASLKRIGLFRKEDSRILSKIFLNVTLPATVIHAFVGFTPGGSLYFLILLGFFVAILPIFIMFRLTRRRMTEPRSFFMINAAGYNIGGFALPIVSLFFGAAGAAYACMFDLGNALIVCGGEYALTTSLLGLDGKKEGLAEKAKSFCKNIFSSVPLDIYLLMLVLMLFKVPIPEVLGQVTEPIANANGFISMFMLGLMFHIEHNQEKLTDVIKILIFRVVFGVALGMLVYHLLPFEEITRKVAALCMVAPAGSISPVYTEKIGADSATSSFLNSLSVIASFIIMFLYMFVLW
jgi:predicted permease